MIETARKIRDLGLPVAFASFDLEERGLRGARYHADNLSITYLRQRIKQLIDLECLGSGKDLFLTDKGGCDVRNDTVLNDRIEHVTRTLGIPLIRDDCYATYADHVPFATKGIPVTQIASIDYRMLQQCRNNPRHPRDIGLINHSGHDRPKNIQSTHLVYAKEILCEFLSRM